ncbi:MAG TPA: PASTA domain-containing protein [Flavobacteriales bacterium]|nr:PASTA domain-containing protein [Flavobacteriales bacterium]
MSFRKFLISKSFFINLLVSFVLIGGILWYIFNYLDDYTLHGQTITVPDLSGMTIEELDSYMVEKKLRYVISDSIFDVKAKKGVVLEQDPKPDVKVKENRRVYIVVNALQAPKIKMPNLVDLSLKMAIATLETYGFTVGELEYKPDLARDAVIGQKINDEEIEPGTMVTKGATIDLVMGDGYSDEQVHVPMLIGLRMEEAILLLKTSSLNAGGFTFDESVITSSDTANARIWKQQPDFRAKMIHLGGYVDMGLTVDQNIIKVDTTYSAPPEAEGTP